MMKYVLGLVLLVVGIAAVAQAPEPDATVVVNNDWDYAVGYKTGVKILGKNGGRVLVVKDGVVGVDDQNRIRFQLFTDGTEFLYNDRNQASIILDGLNGQIIVRGMGISVNDKLLMPAAER
jgi:hypothetical protein